jgi:hypothetical protein
MGDVARGVATPPAGRRTTYHMRRRIAEVLSLALLPLPWLLALFGSDKERPGQHAYGASYDVLFRHLRLRRVKLLEIGILGGDSLLAWRAYFPRGEIVGCDIEPKQHLGGGRIRVHTTDQGSTADLDALARAEGPFDIIIDDGSHRSAHQLFAFRRLFPHLKDGGIYVIEDVQTSFWPGEMAGFAWDGKTIDDPAFGLTCIGEFLALAPYLNHQEFVTLDGVDAARLALGRQIRRIAFEHNLIIVEKGPNLLPSNLVRR